jgi:hypothetical protein
MFSLPRHRFSRTEEVQLSDPELLVIPDVHGDDALRD